MKNKNIKKINDLGRIGKILSVILIVITTIGLVMCIIFGIAMATLPDDFLQVDSKRNSTTVLNAASPLVGTNDEAAGDYESEFSILGLNVKTKSKEVQDSSDKNIYTTTSETTIEGNAGKTLKTVAIGMCVLIFFLLLLLIIALRYAKSLCKALEKCDSPFEENVVTKMRKFAISLIPWGVFCVGAGGVSAIGIAFIVIVVCLFSAIFRHGAELQRESDELL